MNQQDGKILEGFAAGEVTVGEISEAMFYPLDTALIKEFVEKARTGGIRTERVIEVTNYLRQKADQYLAFIAELPVS